jgi:hypothetical protein
LITVHHAVAAKLGLYPTGESDESEGEMIWK